MTGKEVWRTIPAGPPLFSDSPMLKKAYGQEEFVIRPKHKRAVVPKSRCCKISSDNDKAGRRTYTEDLQLVH